MTGSCPSPDEIVGYATQTIDEVRRADIVAHLRSCPECRCAVLALARSPSILDDAETFERSRDRSAGEPLLVRGTAVGRYLVLELLGRGGMGVVYSAYDPELDRKVALKLLRTDRSSPELSARLRREAQAMARLAHPNVIAVHDAGTHGERVFIAMELVEGQTLRQWLAGEVSWRARLDRLLAAAEGLAAAHAIGLVHRDFKPDNVLVGRDGRVRVTDFGLARRTDDAGEEPGQLVGTPAYMAPEQLRRGETDARADQFSFCVTLWESLYGRRPFVGRDLASLVDAIGAGPGEPPASEVPATIARIIGRGLAVEPPARWPSLDELARALADAARPRRRPWPAWAAAGAVVLAGIGFGVLRPTPRVGALDVPDRPAIALLGFANLGGRSEEAWLSTALTEMLADELVAGEELRRIPGAAVSRVAREVGGAASGAPDAGAMRRLRTSLDADYAITGAYLARGDGQVRLDWQLVDLARGVEIAGSTAVGTEDALGTLTSEGAGRLRAALGVPASPAPVAKAAPTGLLAIRRYAEGLDRLRSLDAAGARRALEEAVAADPESAVAHAALARALDSLGAERAARTEAERADALASGLSRADRLSIAAARAQISNEWDRAIAAQRELVTRFPDDLDAGLELAAIQTRADRYADALSTLAALRRRPPPASSDPRIDLAEAIARYDGADYGRAHQSAARARARAEQLGEAFVVAAADDCDGLAFGRQGDTRAVSTLDRAIAEYRAIGADGEAATSENVVAEILVRGGDVEGAARYVEDSVATFRRLGNAAQLAHALHEQAIIQRKRGDVASARRAIEQAVVELADGNERALASAELDLGLLLADVGELGRACATAEQARAHFHRLGRPVGESLALASLAAASADAGELGPASQRAAEALGVARAVGFGRGAALAEAILGELALDEGDFAAAERRLLDAAEGSRANGDAPKAALANASRALALAELGRIVEAWAAVVAARAQAAQSHSRELRDAVEVGLIAVEARLGGGAAAAIDALDQIAARQKAAGLFGEALRTRLAAVRVRAAARRADGAALAALVDEARARGYERIARLAARR